MILDRQFYWVEHQGSPSDQFKAIDENGDGAVSFDEWLGFAYKNYQVSWSLMARVIMATMEMVIFALIDE